MSWMRIETAVARHRKFLKAGPAASWLYICGLAYCQEGLTNGFIPSSAVPSLGVRRYRVLLPLLVDSALWHRVDGGYQVHDYLDWNRDSDYIRAVQGERRKAGSQGGKASSAARRANDAKQSAEASGKQGAEANLKQTANPSVRTAVAVDQIDRARAVPPSAGTFPQPVENSGTEPEAEHEAEHEPEPIDLDAWTSGPTTARKLRTEPSPNGNYRALVKLAHTCIDEGHAEPELVAEVKARAAQLGIDVGRDPAVALDVVVRAVASATTQRKLGLGDSRRG